MKAKEIIAMIDDLIEDGYEPYHGYISCSILNIGFFTVTTYSTKMFEEKLELSEHETKKIWKHVISIYDKNQDKLKQYKQTFVEGGLKALKGEK